MSDKRDYFVRLIREACDLSIQDGQYGCQLDHIEKIELVQTDPHYEFEVHMYFEFKSREVKRMTYVEVCDYVGRVMGWRACSIGSGKSFEGLNS